jgi:hypothetical protein
LVAEAAEALHPFPFVVVVAAEEVFQEKVRWITMVD